MKPRHRANRYHEQRVERAFLRVYRLEARAEQHGQCCYCREPMSVRQTTAEHVEARARGGSSQRKNIKAACEPCNRAKGSRLTAGQFRALLHLPSLPVDCSRAIAKAWIRFRVWRRVHLFEKRVMAAVRVAA